MHIFEAADNTGFSFSFYSQIKIFSIGYLIKYKCDVVGNIVICNYAGILSSVKIRVIICSNLAY